jgi:hypothetical protein
LRYPVFSLAVVRKDTLPVGDASPGRLSRADADNAYRNALGLSPQQFIQLETIRMQQAVCGPQKDGHTTPRTFILNGSGATPIINAGK